VHRGTFQPRRGQRKRANLRHGPCQNHLAPRRADRRRADRRIARRRPRRDRLRHRRGEADRERYQSFGDKASGGPGDTASGEWIEGELKALGYAVARQPFDIPAYEGEATLTAGSARAGVIPQAIVVPTPAGGVSGPLYAAGSGTGAGIALVVLPHARWSTVVGQVERRVQAAFAAGPRRQSS
jgi:hypothetical protein